MRCRCYCSTGFSSCQAIPSESDPPPVKKIRPQTQTPESETPSKDPSPSSIPSSSSYWINPCKLTRNIALLFDDRDYIGQHKWICDRIIDASQAIIKHQYKVKGLQSTLFAATPDHFAKQTGEWYQIINTTPTSGVHTGFSCRQKIMHKTNMSSYPLLTYTTA